MGFCVGSIVKIHPLCSAQTFPAAKPMAER